MFGKINKKLFFPIFFLTTSFLTFFLFGESFSSYFFQDDWFSLYISKISSVWEFFAFFKPQEGLIYYRPLGMQLVFFVLQSLFGLTPVPFRIITLIFHSANGFLVYKLLSLLTKNEQWSKTGAFLYLTSSIHMTIFFWAATISFVMAPAFFLSSFYWYLIDKKYLSFITFFLGLFVNELLVTIPIVVLLWEVILHKKKKIKTSLVLLSSSFVYTIFRLTIAKPPGVESYSFASSPSQIIINIRDYFLWIMHWPEEIHNQFIRFFLLNPKFIHEFLPFVIIFSVMLITAFIVFVFIPVISFTREGNNVFNKSLLIFGGLWFFITLFPVLFFSQHVYSYYLPIPFVGILIMWHVLFEKARQALSKKTSLAVLSIFVLTWLFSSFANSQFNSNIHWAQRRARLSKKLVMQIQSQYPTIKRGGEIRLSKDEESKWALGNQSAMKVIYNDSEITTIYGEKKLR